MITLNMLLECMAMRSEDQVHEVTFEGMTFSSSDMFLMLTCQKNLNE